jgi:hypothetical protein
VAGGTFDSMNYSHRTKSSSSIPGRPEEWRMLSCLKMPSLDGV